jgi:hypothetical protein
METIGENNPRSKHGYTPTVFNKSPLHTYTAPLEFHLPLIFEGRRRRIFGRTMPEFWVENYTRGNSCDDGWARRGASESACGALGIDRWTYGLRAAKRLEEFAAVDQLKQTREEFRPAELTSGASAGFTLTLAGFLPAREYQDSGQG